MSVLADATRPIVNSPSPSGTPDPLPAVGDVLDAQALARLQALDPHGNAGLVTRVLATYTQSLQRQLEQIRAARDRADLPAVRLAAHTLKSSSASVGALVFSGLCADAESRLRDGQEDGLGALLDALDVEGRRVLAALRSGPVAAP
jgi:HPt (histidine-containing phosphotransfer) domain-containing protein